MSAKRLQTAEMLLEQAITFLRYIQEQLGDENAICGIVLPNAAPDGSPVACAHRYKHDGPHSWASLPTVAGSPTVPTNPPVLTDKPAVGLHSSDGEACHRCGGHCCTLCGLYMMDGWYYCAACHDVLGQPMAQARGL